MEVSTGRFKKWFGDWLAATQLDAVDRKSIAIKSTDLDKPQAEVAYRALSSVVNVQDGKTINFVNSVFGKIAGHKGNALLFRVIPQLNEVVGQSQPIYFEKEANPQKHSNIVGYRNYLAKVVIDGTDYYVRTTVQEKTNTRQGNKPQAGEFHSAFISDVQIIKAGSQSVSSGISTPTTESLTSFDFKLADFIKKSQDVSKAIDANGEPLVVYHGGLFIESGVFNISEGGGTFNGIFTHPEWRVARDYAEPYRKNSGRITPLFINARNIANKGLVPPVDEEYVEEIRGNQVKQIKQAREQGFDALWTEGTTLKNAPPDFPALVFFERNQAKLTGRSEDAELNEGPELFDNRGNIGTYSNERDSILQQVAGGDDLGFYSQAERVVRDIRVNEGLLLYRDTEKGRGWWHGQSRLQLLSRESRRSNTPSRRILTQTDLVNKPLFHAGSTAYSHCKKMRTCRRYQSFYTFFSARALSTRSSRS